MGISYFHRSLVNLLCHLIGIWHVFIFLSICYIIDWEVCILSVLHVIQWEFETLEALWKNVWMDRRTDGQTDRQMDGYTEGWT